MTDRRKNLPEIINGIAAGRVRLEHRAELTEIVHDWARDYGARFDSIAGGRISRSNRIRKAVREAAQRTLRERPGLSVAEAVGIIRRRAWAALKETNPDARCPCTKTVKTELRSILQKSDTSRATCSRSPVYDSSMCTTHTTT